MRRWIPLLRDLPVEVSVLASIAFFVALGFGIVIPSIPIFADSFGVSALAASAVVSAFALMRFVSSPFAGSWTNRFGERNVLATGLAIVALSSLFAGLAQNYPQLLLLRGIGGIGSAMFTVSAMALLLRVVDADQRGRALRHGQRHQQHQPAAHRRADQHDLARAMRFDQRNHLIAPAAERAFGEVP